MAEMLGEAPSTVQSWKSSERIPSKKQPLVLAKAQEAGFEVTADDVVFPFGKPDTEAAPAKAA